MADNQAFSGAITLDYAPPPADLREHFSVFYEFRADVPVFEDTDKADRAQLRFILSGGGTYGFADGHVQRTPSIQIVGPTTGPMHARLNGPVHGFGVGIFPVGWAAMLDFDASLLVNRVVDATELFGDAINCVMAAIRTASTIEEKVEIVSAAARGLMARNSTAAFDFTRIVDHWLESSPTPDLDALAAAAGLSRRQVERRCNAYYGSPPKLLARKYRALKAMVAMARGDAEASTFLNEGFYDQSHFIREIKAFTGVTPKTIASDLPTLATLTLKRAELHELSSRVTQI
ncbi:MAG: helix-turn-helix domain-containing protein [Sphingomonadales bacterium]